MMTIKIKYIFKNQHKFADPKTKKLFLIVSMT